jgi:hypothetical protein
MDQKTLKQLEKLIQKLLNQSMLNVATKDDLKNFATKDDFKQLKADLKQLKADLIEEIKDSEGFIVGSVDKHKADKVVVEELDKRVTKIERKLVH